MYNISAHSEYSYMKQNAINNNLTKICIHIIVFTPTLKFNMQKVVPKKNGLAESLNIDKDVILRTLILFFM